jgi:hypothetical protein
MVPSDAKYRNPSELVGIVRVERDRLKFGKVKRSKRYERPKIAAESLKEPGGMGDPWNGATEPQRRFAW